MSTHKTNNKEEASEGPLKSFLTPIYIAGISTLAARSARRITVYLGKKRH